MKKIVVLLLALTLALACVACGDAPEPPTTGKAPTSQNDATKPSSQTETTAPQMGTTAPTQQPPVAGELTEEVLRNYPVTSVSNFEYEPCEGGVRITNYVGTNDIVVIPETIEGQPVVRIAVYTFANESIVRGVLIPDTVKAIEELFPNNSNLEIVIGDGIVDVGKLSFGNCANLKTIVLSKELTTIGDSAFLSCVGLTKLYIPSTVTEMDDLAKAMAFFWCTNLTIYGEAGSYIETVANEQGIPFVAE